MMFNLMGQEVATLVEEKQSPGRYRVRWNAKGFSSGIYFIQLETDRGVVRTQKVVLLK